MLVNSDPTLTATVMATGASAPAPTQTSAPSLATSPSDERRFPSDRINLSANAQARLKEPAEDDGPGGELTEEEQARVEELKARDREVRAHEMAHATVGGAYAGAPSYTYQTGPDGQRYAVGGEVSIDTAPIEGDPEATIAKMEQVKAAALAPAEPSAQDRKVAALADAQRLQAQADLAAQRREERENPDAEDGASVVAGLVQAGQAPAALGRQAYEKSAA